MKTKILGIVAFFMIGALSVLAENKTEEIKIKGSDCDECKAYIEKVALDVEGVTMAHWDVETQKLKVTFDDAKTSSKDIQKAIAKGGIDTPDTKAEKEDLDKVPECCNDTKGEGVKSGGTVPGGTMPGENVPNNNVPEDVK